MTGTGNDHTLGSEQEGSTMNVYARLDASDFRFDDHCRVSTRLYVECGRRENSCGKLCTFHLFVASVSTGGSLPRSLICETVGYIF